jgi:uncharacterized protein YlxW (UPF0749 family)
MKDIYYLLLLVLTGVGSSLMTMYMPRMKAVYRRYKMKLKRTKPDHQAQIISLAKKVVELEKQVDNVAERQANREHNLKQRTRQLVREYLEELKK